METATRTDRKNEERVSPYTLSRAIRDGAKLVDDQLFSGWVGEEANGDITAACVLGAAYLALVHGERS